MLGASCCRGCASSPLPARRHDIGLTIDAEEADRLDLSLDLLEAPACDPALARLGRPRPRRAGLPEARRPACSTGCADLARAAAPAHPGAPGQGRLLGQRDQARAGSRAAPTIPVFTRKVAHRRLVPRLRAQAAGRRRTRFYPQFATHNAHTHRRGLRVGGGRDASFEFQRLHGMGEALYDEVVGERKLNAALPHLRAGRRARGPARLPGAPPAGERRQHLLRQPHRRRAMRRSRSSSPIPSTSVARERRHAASAASPLPPRHLRARAAQQRAASALTEPDRARDRCCDDDRGRAASAFDAPRRIVGGEVSRRAGGGAGARCPHDRRERIGTVRTADSAADRGGASRSARAAAARPGTGCGGPRARADPRRAPPTCSSATARA